MEAHTIKVAIDKVFFTNEREQRDNLNFKDIIASFKGKKTKYITTFTNQQYHSNLLRPITSLSEEDQYLKLKFREFNITNGLEIIERVEQNRICKEDIEKLPDIIFTNNKKLQDLSSQKGILCLDENCIKQPRKVKLCLKKISDFFTQQKQLPFWKVRIEDRYLLKNIKYEIDAENLFASLNISRPSQIDIIYSDNPYDYKDWKLTYYEIKNEINKRKELILNVGKKHRIRFYTKAGHDRYVCTNSSLFIIGNSVTSNKKTHITYFPLLEFYKDYFNV